MGSTPRCDPNRLLIKYGPFLNQKHYKELCNIVIGGDPKRRKLRGLELDLYAYVNEVSGTWKKMKWKNMRIYRSIGLKYVMKERTSKWKT